VSRRYLDYARRAVVGAALLVGLSACSYVKIVHSDGTEETRFTAIGSHTPVVPSDIPRSVHTTSIGVASAADRIDVGLHNEDVVYMPPNCHAMFIVRSEAEAETAAKLAKGVNAECVTVQ